MASVFQAAMTLWSWSCHWKRTSESQQSSASALWQQQWSQWQWLWDARGRHLIAGLDQGADSSLRVDVEAADERAIGEAVERA